MARRSEALTIAVLGLLNESPLHGYELRKRLDTVVGALRRRISFGSLYPSLRDLQAAGLIDVSGAATPAPGLAARRARVVYHLTPAGEARLAELLASSGPAAWEDEQFDVHFAFFGRTDAATRLRILEGRRTRLLERLDRLRQPVQRGPGRLDAWAAELRAHTVDSVEREVRWLDGLIERERTGAQPREPRPPRDPQQVGTTPVPSTHHTD